MSDGRGYDEDSPWALVENPIQLATQVETFVPLSFPTTKHRVIALDNVRGTSKGSDFK